MHGDLMNYSTGETVRPATQEEREWSLDAMLDGCTGAFRFGDTTYYVEGDNGVKCVDERYSNDRPFDHPGEFVKMVKEVWDLDLDLSLKHDGWHGPDGRLLLVLA
jgi:hypothetical protein